VPWTNDGRAVQLAFGQGTAAMAANVVDGVVLTIDIENADSFPVDFDALAASAFDFACLTDFDEIRHSHVLSYWRV
jgi:hypothetical protein